MIKRRDFLKVAGSIGGVAVIGFPPTLNAQSFGSNLLAIPPLLAGNLVDDIRRYSLRVQRGSKTFLAGLNTPTFGINGDFLGPTLRMSRGEKVALSVRNDLGEPTTMHWHGLHVPVYADGGPHHVIDNGTTWEPEFTVMQAGGTCWYHSHLLNRTGEQVYKGLAGMIIIDDEETLRDELPSEYGIDDIPLIVQDRAFNQDGSFRYVGMRMDVMTGMFGDTILVNGTPSPYFEPTTTRVRFRLLNGSNARTYTLAFSDGRSFEVIASDGGLLPAAVRMTSVELAPAERVELVVDFSNGNPVNLVSLPMSASSPNNTQGMMRNMLRMNHQTFDILAVRPRSQLRRSASLPATLTAMARLQESDAVVARTLVLSMAMGGGMAMRGGMRRGRTMGTDASFFINGESMDMNVINQHVFMGDTEIWQLVNDSMMMHPFHIHHGQFQILDRNGRPPPAHEMGHKDTVKVGPGETVRFIMRFEHFSDAEHAYMYHCHILEHEDNGMMGQFFVT
ncbi:MAG: multicopper oxidase domain-containing protein [Pseudohongiellaceae bacterium]